LHTDRKANKKILFSLAAVLIGIIFTTVLIPQEIPQALGFDKLNNPKNSTLSATAVHALSNSVTNGILTASVQDGSSIGRVTMTTGSSHPEPNQNILYNPCCTDYNTVRVIDTHRDYVEGSTGNFETPGYTEVNLDTMSPTTTVNIAGTEIDNSWSTTENLAIQQQIEVQGSTLSDSRIRESMTITNNDAVPHQVAPRFFLDWFIGSYDGTWIQPYSGTTPLAITGTETDYTPPIFSSYALSGCSSLLCTSTNFGTPFTLFGSISTPSGATTPVRFVYGWWSAMYDTIYDYTSDQTRQIGSPVPNVDSSRDSASLYYFAPKTLQPGQSTNMTIFISTTSQTIVQPIQTNFVEGAPFSGTVAHFTNPNPSAPTSEFTATIDWGDGAITPDITAGTVVAHSGGGFDVNGTHTYAEEGSYPLTVNITDSSGPTITNTNNVSVADASLTSTATPINTVQNIPFSGTVAHFTDADPAGVLGDYTAIIDWGDGTIISPDTTTGTVVANLGGGFDVNGTHTYTDAGSHTLFITINDAGGATTTATSTTITQTGPSPNLFVSAENSQFNNYFAGPQVIQVIVSDPDINRLDQSYGEPTVTVNGKKLRMAQATDGNWYAYFADSKEAQIADSTAPMDGHGLNFGNFCSPASGSAATGADFAETKGIAIASQDTAGNSNGTQTPSSLVSFACTGAIGYSTEHVIRENRTLNTNPGGQVGQIASPGSSALFESAWPVIQLYDFSGFPITVIVDYQKAGGDQTVNLTFDRIPTNLVQSSLDRTLYQANTPIFVTLNDTQLNIDPTEQDSWTWGSNPANNTLYYQAFDRNGQPDADGFLAGSPAMQNLIGNLTSFMFNHNGKFTLDPAPASQGGVNVVDFQANGKEPLLSTASNSATRGTTDQVSTNSIGHNSGPVTFIESGGVNTGTFVNSDNANISDLITSNSTTIIRHYATMIYNDVSTNIVGTSNSCVTTLLPIPVGTQPQGIAFDSANGNLYVTNFFDNTVSMISGAINTVIGSPIAVGSHPVGIAFDSANGNLYVANDGSNIVSVIDSTTNTVIDSITVDFDPLGIAFDSANGNLYVVNDGAGTVSVINGTTNTVIGSIVLPGPNPNGIVFDSANGNLYVTNDVDVTVINGATNTVIGSPIPVGPFPQGIAFDSANGNLYVTNQGSNNVYVINGATNTVIGSPIPVGTGPQGIAFDSANGNLYVTNAGSNTVSVINGTTNTVIGSQITVGNNPVAIAFDSANGNLYVTNAGSNTVSVISIQCNTITVPTISLSPIQGPAGTAVTVSGSGFTPGGTITFTYDGSPITTTPGTVLANSTGNIPAGVTFLSTGTAGSKNVIATDTASSQLSNTATFTVTVPTISLSPIQGPVGTTVTISGSGFTPGGTITFTYDGSPLTTSPSTVLANSTGNIPAGVTFLSTGTAGSKNVIATDSASSQLSNTATFTIITPTILLSPTSGPAGVIVSVTGSNYIPSHTLTVKFNGVIVTTSPPTITSTISGAIPAGTKFTVPPSPGGGKPVTVTDGTNTSPAATFTINPTISLSPTQGSPGSMVSVAGAGYLASSTITIKYDGVTQTTTPIAVTTNTAGSFSATFAAPASAHGTHTVLATDLTNTASTSFLIKTPTISLIPISGLAGSTVTITGSGYVAGSHITIAYDGTPRPTSPGTVTATPTGSIPGGVTFTVPISSTTGAHTVSAKDASSNTASSTFTVIKPTITSFTPTSGLVGIDVTITGTSFTGTTSVKFNGVSATFTVLSSTSIKATVPVAATTGKISIVTSGVNAISGSNFLVLPKITSFNPPSGPAGAVVTITGSGFTGATSVKFNGVSATFTVLSSTSIKATVPATASTGTISVTTSGGTATSAGNFVVLPKIISFTPTSGHVGAIITITGSGFTDTTSVKFNGASAAFTVVSSTSIKVTVPVSATTGKIVVITAGGTATSTTNFTVIP
jgi:YVTN family beta-propeller protein